jgi:hypothetical protein
VGRYRSGAVAWLALAVSIGAVVFAATARPRYSVEPSQLRPGTISISKLSPGARATLRRMTLRPIATRSLGDSPGASTLDIRRQTWAVVFSQRLANLKKGETIIALGQSEVTNDFDFPVLVSGQLVLANSAKATRGVTFTPGTAFNLTPEMHHGVVVQSGIQVQETATKVMYVNLVLYAAAERAKPGAKITVNRSNGHLDVLRLVPG